MGSSEKSSKAYEFFSLRIQRTALGETAAVEWVCLRLLSGSLTAAQKTLQAKTNRLQENAYPATYLGFQSSKERLCFHLAPKTPFALFSNIFNKAKKRVLFVQISSLLTKVNITREDSENSLEFS